MLLLRSKQLGTWAESQEGRKADAASFATKWIKIMDLPATVHSFVYDCNVFRMLDSDVAAGLIRVFGLEGQDLLSRLKRSGEEDQGMITSEVLDLEVHVRDHAQFFSCPSQSRAFYAIADTHQKRLSLPNVGPSEVTLDSVVLSPRRV